MAKGDVGTKIGAQMGQMGLAKSQMNAQPQPNQWTSTINDAGNVGANMLGANFGTTPNKGIAPMPPMTTNFAPAMPVGMGAPIANYGDVASQVSANPQPNLAQLNPYQVDPQAQQKRILAVLAQMGNMAQLT